jgi:hypothetical protein
MKLIKEKIDPFSDMYDRDTEFFPFLCYSLRSDIVYSLFENISRSKIDYYLISDIRKNIKKYYEID